jgi:hypothetical protein
MKFTERDLAIVEMVYSYRMVIPEQVRQLICPNTSISQVRLRLRYLFHHGYLHRAGQWQKHGEPPASYVYFLDQLGAQTLADYYECDISDIDWTKKDREMGPLHQKHLIQSNDARILVTLSAQANPLLDLVEWRDEKTLRRLHQTLPVTITLPDGTKKTVYAIGDGYMVLDATTRKRGFWEIDRATVPTRLWQQKVRAYQSLYNSGIYHKHYHSQAMTIWTLTPTEARLETLLEATIKADGQKRWWFCSWERLASGANILTDRVWSIATSSELGRLVE